MNPDGLDHPQPRVVLIGPMGAGKTTVAGILAELWGVAARDTDRDVEAAEGRSISDIFVDSGEAEFRRLERLAVAEALGTHDGVLALGGERSSTRAPVSCWPVMRSCSCGSGCPMP